MCSFFVLYLWFFMGVTCDHTFNKYKLGIYKVVVFIIINYVMMYTLKITLGRGSK